MLPTRKQIDHILTLSNRVYGATCDGTQLQRLVSEATDGKRFLWQLSDIEAQEVVARLRELLRVRRQRINKTAIAPIPEPIRA